MSVTGTRAVDIDSLYNVQHRDHSTENSAMVGVQDCCGRGFKTLGLGGHYNAALYRLHWPQQTKP